MWLPFSILGLLLGLLSGAAAGAVLGALFGYLLTKVGRLEERLRNAERRLSTLAAEVAKPERATAAEPIEAMQQPQPPPMAPAATTPRTVAETDGVAVSMQAETPDRHGTPETFVVPDLPGLLSRLLSGNLLAKLGMVLLFFGIASALKLAVDYGVLPPWLRLLAASLAALLAIWAGAAPASGRPFRPAWLARFAPDSEQARLGFGFALQGGGFGILYIAIWFALQQYGYLTATTAFILFAGLSLACLVLAMRQDSQSFALLGLIGAFLAPMLVPSQGNHVVLFAYLVLLDAFILAASLFRAWRLLIVVSLGATVALALGWAASGYRAELRGDVEIFMLALFLLYSATPWQAARHGPPAQWGWQSATLLFGPPVLAATVQVILFRGDSGTLAMSSLAAGLWYGLLHLLTRPTGDRLLLQVQARLALTFLSLTPYLAFSRKVSGMFWALEGGALVWYGRRTSLGLPVVAGLLLQLFAGLIVAGLWLRGPDAAPFLNSAFHDGLLLVAAGALSSYALREQRDAHRVLLAWTLVWWFGIFYLELTRRLSEAEARTLLLALASLTAAALEWAGRRLAMPDARLASALLLPATIVALLASYLETGHPLANGLWLAFPIAAGIHCLLLRRHEADALDWFIYERHVGLFWLAVWALAWEVAWLTAGRPPPADPSLSEALRALVLAGAVVLVLRAPFEWPFARHRDTYLLAGLAVPVALSWFWLFYTGTSLAGDWALPYLPILNPLDAAALFLLWSLHGHWRAAGRFALSQGYPVLFGLALLLWLSLMLARTVHHWTGVAFRPTALWHSDLLQALLSLSWAAFALAVMVTASRRHIRPAWFAGLGLLLLVCVKLVSLDLANVGGLLRVLSLIGVGLLVLGAGYLAPVPPRRAVDQSPA